MDWIYASIEFCMKFIFEQSTIILYNLGGSPVVFSIGKMIVGGVIIGCFLRIIFVLFDMHDGGDD